VLLEGVPEYRGFVRRSYHREETTICVKYLRSTKAKIKIKIYYLACIWQPRAQCALPPRQMQSPNLFHCRFASCLALMGLHHWQCPNGGAQYKKNPSGKDSGIEGQPLPYCLCCGLVTKLLAYIHTIILNAQKRVLYQGMLFNCQLRP
jgi:hypothetical protein